MRNVLAAGSSRHESIRRREVGSWVFTDIAGNAIHPQDAEGLCILHSRRKAVQPRSSSDPHAISPAGVNIHQVAAETGWFQLDRAAYGCRKAFNERSGAFLPLANEKNLPLRIKGLANEGIGADTSQRGLPPISIDLFGNMIKPNGRDTALIALKRHMRGGRISRKAGVCVDGGRISCGEGKGVLPVETQYEPGPGGDDFARRCSLGEGACVTLAPSALLN